MKIRQSKGDITYQVISRVILILLAVSSIFPFLLLVVSSFTDENTIINNGYSMFPEKTSLAAYEYLVQTGNQLFRAYGITVLVTVIGTLGCLVITSMLAYPLSRKELPGRRGLSFFVFFTMLFNGGLVPTYLMYTQIFHIKNTIWGLIVPNLMVNAYYVMLMRTFFETTIPFALIDAAKVDGAGEFKTFYSVVLPLTKPILATVGLFAGIAYWNDWYNGMVYLTDSRLFSVQNILNRMITDIQFLSSNANLAGNVGSVGAIPSSSARMAIAVVGMLPIIIIYPFIQKNFVKGIALGAVKG